MNARSVLMFLGCLLGGFGGVAYWFASGNSEMGNNLFSVVLYGILGGIFVADLVTQGMNKNQA